MKKIAALTLLIMLGTNARSDEALDALEIHALKNAKSEAEISKKLKEIEQARTMKIACDLQISSSKLPYSCYDARKIMKELKLSTSGWLAKDLDQTCVRIAHQTNEIAVRKRNALPKSCLTAAQEQIQINQYKTGKVFD